MSSELLFSAAFLAGFFGSGHCLGMCGPVVVLLENQPAGAERQRQVMRRLLYNSGRLLFYMLLGLIAGMSGAILTRLAGLDVALSVLRILASLLVVVLGLNLLWNIRLFSFLEKGGTLLWKQLSPLAKHVVPMTSPARALGAGFLWGALPCGLVYSAVALAASSGDPITGATITLAFWGGTLPALLVAGASARKLAVWSGRPAFRRLAGALMVIVGAVALFTPVIIGAGSEHGGHHQAVVVDERSDKP